MTPLLNNKITRLPGGIKFRFYLIAVWVFFLALVLEVNPVIPIFIICIGAYLKLQPNLNKYSLLKPGLLFVIVFTAAYFFIREHIPLYFLPFCAVPMLVTLLFNDLGLSLIVTLISSASIGSIAGNFYTWVMFFTSGIASSMLVLGARRRTSIIHAGLLVGILQAVLLALVENFQIFANIRYVFLMANGIVCSGIAMLFLPVFEYLFNTVTNISLLELADFHHPLLQRMILEAPGTYHHSLVVGNLSEVACDAVGANALLARIGAYYHDIGKLEKPDYFSENQCLRESRHDTLTPSMSKLVIMNHVKEGIDLAAKHKLNSRIVDFIRQHHGNSLVYYFYRKALEGLEDDQKIKEEGFRYPGPKPDTRETAIVLLADSVEAATRTIKDVTPAKIEEVVHKIINNKFIDGQLDQCELTLKDLEKIAAVFIRILSGIYHSRITYPEQTSSSK